MKNFFANDKLNEVIEEMKLLNKSHEFHVIAIEKTLLKDKNEAEQQRIVMQHIIDAFETHQ